MSSTDTRTDENGMLELFDCPGQPGHVRINREGCGRMYLAAQTHTLTRQWRGFGHKTMPPGLMGTSLANCLFCEVGKENSQKEMREVQTMAKEEAPCNRAAGVERQALDGVRGSQMRDANGRSGRAGGMTQDMLEQIRARERETSNARRRAKFAPYLAQDGLKRCQNCGETKPVSEFLPHKGCMDGLWPNCNPCRKKRQREIKAGAVPIHRGSWRKIPAESAPSPVDGGTTKAAPPAAREFSFCIVKDDADQHLLRQLLQQARRERRNPEQQILKILDLYFGEEPPSAVSGVE